MTEAAAGPHERLLRLRNFKSDYSRYTNSGFRI